MDRKCIIAIVSFFCAFFWFSHPAEAQEYMITEAQLQRLETESAILKEENLKLKKSNQNLKEQVTKLDQVSTDRQNTIMLLTESCSKLETKLSDENQKKIKLLQENNDLRIKEKNDIIIVIILVAVIVLYTLAIVFYFFLKKKGSRQLLPSCLFEKKLKKTIDNVVIIP